MSGKCGKAGSGRNFAVSGDALVNRKFYRFLRDESWKSPKEMSVLCFPDGGSNELDDVYPRLGCKPENVTAVVTDRSYYDELRGKGGIRVVDSDPLHFLRNDGSRFDVISLKKGGTLTDYHRDILTEIGSRDTIDGKSVLLTCFDGREETKRDPQKHGYMTDMLGNMRRGEEMMHEAVSCLQEICRKTNRRMPGMTGVPRRIVDRKTYDNRMEAAEITVDILQAVFEFNDAEALGKSQLFSRMLDYLPAKLFRDSVKKGRDCYTHFVDEAVKHLDARFLLGERDFRKKASTERQKARLVDDFPQSAYLMGCFERGAKIFGWPLLMTTIMFTYDIDMIVPGRIALYSYQGKDGKKKHADMYVIRNSRDALESAKEYYDKFFHRPVFWWATPGATSDPKEVVRSIQSACDQSRNLQNVQKSLFSDLVKLSLGRLDRIDLDAASERRKQSSLQAEAESTQNATGQRRRPPRPRHEVMPSRYLNRLRPGSQMRVHYFMSEDLDSLNPQKRKGLFDTIRRSGWYSSIDGKMPPKDIDVYTFFTDLMMMARNGERITTYSVKQLWSQYGH